MAQCSATTVKGPRCSRPALYGVDVCHIHAGAAVGRKRKLTVETADAIVRVLSAGGYIETAAAAAGIGKSTLDEWLARGDPEGADPRDEEFRAFRVRVDEARAIGEARNVAIIANAATKDWKAAAWMLERQFPDRWAGPRGRQPFRQFGEDDPPVGGDAPLVVDDQVGADGKPL